MFCEDVMHSGFLGFDGAFRERLGEVDTGDFFDRLEDDTRYKGACWSISSPTHISAEGCSWLTIIGCDGVAALVSQWADLGYDKFVSFSQKMFDK